MVRRAPAFTLLELLISVAIFALVLAAMNSVFYAAVRLRNHTAAALEAKLPLNQAADIIKRDLAGLVVPGGTLSGQFKTSLNPTSMDVTEATAFYTSTGALNDTLAWADVQKVSYLLQDPAEPGTGKDLVRSVTRNLLPQVAEDQPVPQWLMSGVQSLTFTFYDGAQWRDAWDSTTPDTTTGQTNTLPQAIKLQIQMAAESNGQATKTPIEFVVPVVVQARTNLTQQGNGG